MSYRDLLRSGSAGLEINDVLRSSPRVLLGVESFAAETLASLGVETVFDLALSSTFAGAETVLRAAEDPATPSARVGRLPSDLFAAPAGTALVDVPGLDVEALRALPGALAGNVREAFDVTSIRDLALWPPYAAARRILAEASGSTGAADDVTPGDLLPMSGRYPTERAYYSVFVVADVDDPGPAEKQALEDAGPLDPAAALNGTGFSRPVRGARLTFAQSWYSEGVALGQLLHSLALAPGESTRVAMIDWSRQQTGMQREAEGQTEQIVGDVTRKRALSEVQNAVATESQSGFTQTSASSRQVQGGGGGGLSIGPLSLGGSVSGANAQSSATTVTGTSGVRNVAAAMSQNVADSTHQAASAARDRFASVVRELSQAEHEQLSTRVVANYNHMHALTVQYYEVVQIFRTTVALHRFEPCLFVPMQLVQFQVGQVAFGGPGERMVRRFRAALETVALDEETRSMLNPDALGLVRAQPSGTSLSLGQALPAAAESAFEAQAVALRRVFGRDPLVRDGASVELPAECTLTGISVDFPCTRIQTVSSGGTGAVDLTPTPVEGQPGRLHAAVAPAVPLTTLSALAVDTGGRNVGGALTLGLLYRGTPLEVPLGVVFVETPGYQPAVQFFAHEVTVGLLRRLQEDQLYYSQAIWRAMDAAAIASLLAPYSYAGRPMAQVVDPTAVGVSGNFLIFRMPWEARDLLDADADTGGALGAVLADADWSAWVRRHADFSTTAEDLVPLPSGGVFAEAVLGRSNSAEKLDITRFWNWQDSPIPLQAPDIAALQAGSRARDDATTPSSFAAPVVAFNNPPALPDPAGLSGVLGAVANGGLFRDMSGSAVAQALAQAALAQTGAGATAAGSQAATNLATAAQKEVEMAKLAASLVSGGLTGGPTGSISEQGAKINEGRSLDERATGPADGALKSPDTTTHETQAAEGHAGRVLDLVGKAIGDRTGPADGNGVPGSGSAGGSTPAAPRPGGQTEGEDGPAPSTSATGSTSAPPGRDTSDA